MVLRLPLSAQYVTLLQTAVDDPDTLRALRDQILADLRLQEDVVQVLLAKANQALIELEGRKGL